MNLPRKVDFLLIMRGILASSVIFWHYLGYQYSKEWMIPFTIPGRMAVWLFFVLSGYVMGHGFAFERYRFNRESLFAFWRNRFLRIYPLFFLVTLVGLTVRFFSPNTALIPTAHLSTFVLRQILMLQWVHSYDLNGIFWTLGIEMQFYAITPLICFIQLKNGFSFARSFVIYLLFLSLPMAAAKIFNQNFDNRTLYANLVFFQTGVFCSILRRHLNFKLTSRVFAAISALSAIALMMAGNVLYYRDSGMFLGPRGILLTSCIGVLLVITHWVIENRGTDTSSYTEPLLFLGVLSYGLYALHGLIQTYVIPQYFLISFVCTVALAYSIYLVVEKPLLSLKQDPRKNA